MRSGAKRAAPAISSSARKRPWRAVHSATCTMLSLPQVSTRSDVHAEHQRPSTASSAAGLQAPERT